MVYAQRNRQHLLLKAPPASGKSRAMMFVALDKLANLIPQVYLQVWEKAETDRSLMTADVLKMFLSLKTKRLTSVELLDQSNIASLYKLRPYLLAPVISAGYIEISNPEKPTSSKQRYLLTEVGRSLFGQ